MVEITQAMIEWAAEQISAGLYDYQIGEAARVQYNLPRGRPLKRLLNKARHLLLRRRSATRESMQAQSLGFYESVLRNPGADVADKLKARQRIDQLFGLEEPKRVEVGGPKGAPLPVRLILDHGTANGADGEATERDWQDAGDGDEDEEATEGEL